jgi:protein-S-isoprenylcysteine O-methyltransferase Ste14
MSLARWLVIGCLIAIALRAALGEAKSPARRCPGWGEILWTIALIVFIITATSRTPSDWAPEELQLTGAVVGVLATCWIGWSYHVLGSNFSVDPDPVPSQQLRTTGPYRWIRHPVYSGLIFYTTAVAVVISPALVLLPVLTLWFVRRQVKAEETALAGCHGKQWQDYCASVPGKLVPRPRKRANGRPGSRTNEPQHAAPE